MTDTSNPAPAEIRCLDPWTGHELESMPAGTREDAASAVRRAREAQPAWAARSFEERGRLLLGVRDTFAERAETLVELLGRENGKPPVEAWFAEIVPNLDLFTYWAKRTGKLLRDEKVGLDPTKYPGKKALVHQVPKGIVAVISAWNYPVAISLRAIVPALMAGNTVVFKPSSDAALVGRALVECFSRHLPKDVLVPFYAPGAVGSAIVEAGVDHVAFIGSVEVGREVAALAARRFVSCSLELGGKDAAIVLPDADPDRAVEGIAWGAFTNAGQNCASIERLILVEGVGDAFLPRLVERVKSLRAVVDGPAGSDVGPLRTAGQLAAVEAQVQDALARRAKLLCGGERLGDGFGYAPTILDDVTDEMAVWNEETFGPLLPVRRAANVEEALELANRNRYGLTNSLWTSDPARARELAPRLRCGVVTVNNHAFTASMPFVPWGGVGETGMGSTNSHHALREYVRPQLVLTDRPTGHEAWWYPYDATNLELAKVLRRFLSGKGGMLKVLGLMRRASRRRSAP
ncbi:MAG: aldehyde dehydrogenase family protein [Deltaproteobacteria bacterium]|nr:aldehyde dehydrogenase family protein [Deltaproteobacteria bacterium]